MILTIYKTQNGCIVVRGNRDGLVQTNKLAPSLWSFHSWEAALEQIGELLEEWGARDAAEAGEKS